MIRNRMDEIEESGAAVKVNVTKIVKYVCIAGVLIVAIIFGTKCFIDMLKIQKETN